MVGIELIADKQSKRPFDSRRRVGAEVCTAVRKHGVIIRPLGDVLVLMPPPAMQEEDLLRIVEVVWREVALLNETGATR
jgi:adenosylmethionine-8-amino-7-oxononanoate aminotransferase